METNDDLISVSDQELFGFFKLNSSKWLNEMRARGLLDDKTEELSLLTQKNDELAATLEKVRDQRGVEVRRANELEKEVEQLRMLKARIEAVERVMKGEPGQMAMVSGCAGVMVSIAAENNSKKTVFTQEGVTYDNKELGDWRVTVEKL